jgi:hypothetical protein
MPKVDYKDLEEVTKFLDKLVKENVSEGIKTISNNLSKMIKDKYTEIKPDYDRTN